MEGTALLSVIFLPLLLSAPSLSDHRCPTNCICMRQVPLPGQTRTSTRRLSLQVTCRLNGSEWSGVPQGLPKTLHDLTLTRSAMAAVRSGDLRQYQNLTRLVLQMNTRLTRLEPYFLQDLHNLTLFYCSNNSNLKSLDKFAFSGLRTGALKIFLENNAIKEIAPHAFYNSQGVRKLSLLGNPLVHISQNAFTGLYMADFLYLPKGIQVIEPDAFKNLTRVHIFDLREPKLKQLEGHTFRGLRRVRKLTLSGGSIGVWHSLAFRGLETVHEVHILNMRIRKLKRKALHGMKNVGLFVVEGNRIKRIERRAFKQASADNLVVQNNKFVCSCSNMWILKVDLSQLPKDFLRNNYCDSPVLLRKRALEAIPKSYLESCKKHARKIDYRNIYHYNDFKTKAASPSTIPLSTLIVALLLSYQT